MSNKTILYVEDEFIIRLDVKKILSTVYNNVLLASDGEEGYDIYKNNKIDVLITDISMPKMDGIELVKKIRLDDNDKDLKIIIASAFDKEFFKFDDLDIDEYIIKPITKFELLNKLNGILM